MSPEQINAAVEAHMHLAAHLFDEMRSKTADEVGITREPYGPGEQVAIDALLGVARSLELETEIDPFGNVYMTLPGAQRHAPGWIVGSHVDTVPRGGNFDGLAGVVAGLVAAAAIRSLGSAPRNLTVMAIRAEELSSWYEGKHDGHIGSRAALGLLPQAELDSAIHVRTGKTLREHMRAAGFRPEAVGNAHIDPARLHGYLELHIEQGPVLLSKDVPVGVVTAIRGAARARSCRCLGEYSHSGAVPHEYRSDAVMATVELVRELDLEWERVRNRGGDLVFTVGKLYTDQNMHALTKVPGETSFVLDFRSQDEAILNHVIETSEALAARIAAKRRVKFELSKFSLHRPAEMSPRFRATLHQGCNALGLRNLSMPSGAGHDAQDFVHAGIPAAMIFVRNEHGSHNPVEAMEISDFECGTRLLTWMLARSEESSAVRAHPLQ